MRHKNSRYILVQINSWGITQKAFPGWRFWPAFDPGLELVVFQRKSWYDVRH